MMIVIWMRSTRNILYGVIVNKQGKGENVLYITLAGSNCTIVGFKVLISLLFSNIFSEFFFQSTRYDEVLGRHRLCFWYLFVLLEFHFKTTIHRCTQALIPEPTVRRSRKFSSLKKRPASNKESALHRFSPFENLRYALKDF